LNPLKKQLAITGGASHRSLLSELPPPNNAMKKTLATLMLAAILSHADFVGILKAAENMPGVKPGSGTTTATNALEVENRAFILKTASAGDSESLGTALIFASQEGYKDIVESLIGKGAKLNAKTALGATALMMASQQGHKELAEMLIAKGADVNETSINGSTALMLAALRGHKETVELLTAKGADINSKALNGDTALTMASYNGHKEIVEFLVAKGASNVSKKPTSDSLSGAQIAALTKLINGEAAKTLPEVQGLLELKAANGLMIFESDDRLTVIAPGTIGNLSIRTANSQTIVHAICKRNVGNAALFAASNNMLFVATAMPGKTTPIPVIPSNFKPMTSVTGTNLTGRDLFDLWRSDIYNQTGSLGQRLNTMDETSLKDFCALLEQFPVAQVESHLKWLTDDSRATVANTAKASLIKWQTNWIDFLAKEARPSVQQNTKPSTDKPKMR
jgi:ankyrin repeat protein